MIKLDDRLKPMLSRIVMGFLVFLVAVIGFVYLAEEVVEGDTLAFDQWVLTTINGTSSGLQDSVWTVITEFGGFVGVPIVTVLVALVLVRKKRVRHAIVMVAGVGGAAVINVVLKLMFERVRPDLWEQLVVETSYSFPSGHAMASCALAASLVLVAWNDRWRYPVLAIGIVYVVLIGYSRLYLGVHYPTDVMAGWAIAIAWVLLLSAFAKFWRFSKT